MDEGVASLCVFHRAAGFNFIRPGFYLRRCFRRAMGQQPCADVFVGFGGLNCGFKFRAGNTLKGEKRVVQWAIIVVLPQLSRQFGATFVNGAARNDKPTDSIAWAMWSLFSEVRSKNGCFHNLVGGRFGFQSGGILSLVDSSGNFIRSVWRAALSTCAFAGLRNHWRLEPQRRAVK